MGFRSRVSDAVEWGRSVQRKSLLVGLAAVIAGSAFPAGAAEGGMGNTNLAPAPGGMVVSPESCSHGDFGPNGRINITVCRTEYALPSFSTKRVSVNVILHNGNPIGVDDPYFIDSLVLSNANESQVLDTCAYKGWLGSGELTNCTASIPTGTVKARVFYMRPDTGKPDSISFSFV